MGVRIIKDGPDMGDFDDIKQKTGGVVATLFFGFFCFMVGNSLSSVLPMKPSVNTMGFHFPDIAPMVEISEEIHPYYISLYKENDFWRWGVYKRDSENTFVAAGSTESYGLSRDIALTSVCEDRKYHGRR